MKHIISILLLFTATLSQAQTYVATKVNGTAANSSGDVLIRDVDTIYRNAGNDSIVYTISGTRYSISDATGGGGADSATFATKNYVNSLNAQWSVSRTTDSSNFVFTNGATVTQIKDNGWALLATSNVSNTTSVDFTLPAGYSNYIIDMDTVYAATAGAELWVRVGTPTIQSGATDYQYGRIGHFDGTQAITYAATAAQIQLFGGAMPDATTRNRSLAGVVQLHQPADNVLHKKMQYDLSVIGNNNVFYQFQGWGWYKSATAYTVVRIVCSTGNIYGGFRLFGKK